MYCTGMFSIHGRRDRLILVSMQRRNMSGKQRAVYCAAECSSSLTEERILQMQPWDVQADFCQRH